jgi:hypothetical protein
MLAHFVRTTYDEMNEEQPLESFAIIEKLLVYPQSKSNLRA